MSETPKRIVVREEFWKRYRVVTNGRWFRVQWSEKEWWFGWRTKWYTVGMSGDDWFMPEDYKTEAAARADLKRLALARQRRHDEAQHGWQPLEAAGAAIGALQEETDPVTRLGAAGR